MRRCSHVEFSVMMPGFSLEPHGSAAGTAARALARLEAGLGGTRNAVKVAVVNGFREQFDGSVMTATDGARG